jgi:hypothetical protein
MPADVGNWNGITTALRTIAKGHRAIFRTLSNVYKDKKMRRRYKAGLIVLGLAVLSVTSAALLFYLRHHDSKTISIETAEAVLSDLHKRFANEQPLLDMHKRRSLEGIRSFGAMKPLHWFKVVIFDTRGRPRLVRITVPFWFARHFARHDGKFRWLGELTFLDDTEFDPEAIQLSLAQIEGYGAGLIVDYRHASGGWFMAWVE